MKTKEERGREEKKIPRGREKWDNERIGCTEKMVGKQKMEIKKKDTEVGR